MKHRRWTLALVAGLLAAAMSLSACKKEDPGLAKLQRDGKLTVGVELREPFGVQTGSEVTGLDAELAQALCQELGIQAELVAIEPGKGGRAPGSLFSYGFVFAWRGGVLLLSGYIPNLPRLSDRPVFVRFRRPASDRHAARVCRGIRPAAFDPVTTIKHSIESRERKEEGGRCYG